MTEIQHGSTDAFLEAISGNPRKKELIEESYGVIDYTKYVEPILCIVGGNQYHVNNEATLDFIVKTFPRELRQWYKELV